MPTMRDMALPDFSDRFIDVVDHGSQIGPGRQGLLEGGERTGPRVGSGPVPRLAERPAQSRFLVTVAAHEPVALSGEHLARGRVEATRARLLGIFCDLEHFLEQLGRRLRLHQGALARVAAFLEPHQILDARDRIAQRPIRRVEPRRGFQDLGLPLRRRGLVEVGMALPRELIELPLKLDEVDAQPPREPEYLEMIHALRSPPSEMATGPSSGPFRGSRGPGYAENDVPHPQLDFALGLTNVKPPVSPCWT